MSVYYQNPGSPTGLPFQARRPDSRRSPSYTDTSSDDDSDYENPCSGHRPPSPPHLTPADRYHGYDEVCYVPNSSSATGSGYGRHVMQGQGRLPPTAARVVYYQNRFCPVPVERADQSRDRRVTGFTGVRSYSNSGCQGQHPVGRTMSRQSSRDRSNEELSRALVAQQTSSWQSSSSWQPSSRQPSSRQLSGLPSSVQPSSRQPSSRQPSIESKAPYEQRSRQRPDDVTFRQFNDVSSLPGQPRSRRHNDDDFIQQLLHSSVDDPSSRKRNFDDVSNPLSRERNFGDVSNLLSRERDDDVDDDDDDVTAVLNIKQTTYDEDSDCDVVVVPHTTTISGSGPDSPEVGLVKFSLQPPHVPSTSSAVPGQRTQKRPGVVDPVEKMGGWRDVFRKRKEYAALRKLALFLQDNRTSGSSSSLGVTGKRIARREEVQEEERNSSPLLKRFLNILFITTGMALLLSVVAVIIYTSIDNTSSSLLHTDPDTSSSDPLVFLPSDPPYRIEEQPSPHPLPTTPSAPTKPEVTIQPTEVVTKCQQVPMVRDGIKGQVVNLGRLCRRLRKTGVASVTTPKTEATRRKQS